MLSLRSSWPRYQELVLWEIHQVGNSMAECTNWQACFLTWMIHQASSVRPHHPSRLCTDYLIPSLHLNLFGKSHQSSSSWKVKKWVKFWKNFLFKKYKDVPESDFLVRNRFYQAYYIFIQRFHSILPKDRSLSRRKLVEFQKRLIQDEELRKEIEEEIG